MVAFLPPLEEEEEEEDEEEDEEEEEGDDDDEEAAAASSASPISRPIPVLYDAPFSTASLLLASWPCFRCRL